MEKKKLTVQDFREMKKRKESVVGIVVYNYWMAKAAEKANTDWKLVGDSMVMNEGGYPNTYVKPASMDLMIEHTKWVRNGAPNTFIVGDMPEGSYGANIWRRYKGIKNAKRFIEAGADAIKLEGGKEMAKQVEYIAREKIIVVAHIGLKPQTSKDYKYVFGETAEEGKSLIEDAKVLINAGASIILVEKTTEEVTTAIAEIFPNVPIWGIGAGCSALYCQKGCDGQLLLGCDITGLSPMAEKIQFVKCYATEENYRAFLEQIECSNAMINQNVAKKILPTIARFVEFCFTLYVQDVKQGKFPAEQHVYHMKHGELEKLQKILEK